MKTNWKNRFNKINIQKQYNNYNSILIIGVLIFVFIITSCDCWTSSNGVVVDNKTNLPLDSVIAKSYITSVSEKSLNCEIVTDSTGKYEGTTGNTGKCRDLVMVFYKKGYVTKTVTNPQKNEIIILEKQ